MIWIFTTHYSHVRMEFVLRLDLCFFRLFLYCLTKSSNCIPAVSQEGTGLKTPVLF